MARLIAVGKGTMEMGERLDDEHKGEGLSGGGGSLAGFMATSIRMIVPYFDPPPPGKSSTPSKQDIPCPFRPTHHAASFQNVRKSSLAPHRNGDLGRPQLKSMVCFTVFCSFLQERAMAADFIMTGRPCRAPLLPRRWWP